MSAEAAVIILEIFHDMLNILQGVIKSTDDVKERGRHLTDKYDFDLSHTKKIWCFGPNGSGPNMLVDVSKGVQNLHEIKDSVVAGFQWATSEVCT